MSLRLGVLGAGWVARDRYLPSVARLDGIELGAVYDHSAANALAAAPSGVPAFSDLDEVHAVGLDAVAICTPPWAHEELVVDALRRGVHVLCEKPMAMDLASARRMADAAAAADRILCVSHNFLWSNAMRRARQVLAGAGDIGYVSATQLSSDARRLPSWAPSLPGGLLFDELPHMLYLLDELLGAPLTLDGVRAEWGGRTAEPRSCEIRLRGAAAVGQITVVFGAPVSEWHVTAVADRTVVDIDLFRDVMVSSGDDGRHTAREVLATSGRVAAHHFAGFAASGARLLAGRQRWGHDALIADFADAIERGRPSPVPIERSLAVMGCLDDVIAAIGR